LRQLLANFSFLYFCNFYIKRGIYTKKEISKRKFFWGREGGRRGEMANLICQEKSLGRMNGH
jgi:hypothetical protein